MVFSRTREKSVLGLLVCAALNSAYSSATQINKIAIVENSNMVIDGQVTRGEWEGIESNHLNIVNFPVNNEVSPVVTLAKIARSESHLYLFFISKDTDTQKIIGGLTPRDKANQDDWVGVNIDPNKSGNDFYEFSVSAAGVQNDAKYTEKGREYNYLWDAQWSSKSLRIDDGYQVEMAIPFSELNYSEDQITWGIELVRSYPRSEAYKISNIPRDRDNSCRTCQLMALTGFDQDNNKSDDFTVTPGVTLSKNKERDIYSPESWSDNDDADLSLDLKWNVNTDTVVSGTINPDFSAVEADAGQISVNRRFALYYDEKRDFFLENNDVFSSEIPILYTRNIINPNYGAKISSASGNHQYGAFIVDDDYTNLIEVDELSSEVTDLNRRSANFVASYHYRPSDSFSVGGMTTLRKGGEYSNVVASIDVYYRFDDSNSVTGMLTSSEQDLDGYDRSDTGYQATWYHDSENWSTELSRVELGKDYRADLGIITNVGTTKDSFYGERIEYFEDGFITKVSPFISLSQEKDETGYTFDKKVSGGISIEGDQQFYLSVAYFDKDEVGLRYGEGAGIKGNTTEYSLNYTDLYFGMQILPSTSIGVEAYYGDAIDYYEDRMATKTAVSPGVEVNVNNQFSIAANIGYESLSDKKGDIYDTYLYDFRFSYQSSVYSRFQLSVVFDDTSFDIANNSASIDVYSKNLGIQALYAYEDPLSHSFYAGYSDARVDEPFLGKLSKTEQSVFMKYTYAYSF